MARPAVIGLAASLLVAGIVGKLASAFGAFGMRVDKVLIGIGMIPRGEVGLIFASVGTSLGIIDPRTNGAIIVVVFLTTLLTPPVLAWSLRRKRSSPTSQPA
jgi:Kef-type K+ transport system membrane component KefB